MSRLKHRAELLGFNAVARLARGLSVDAASDFGASSWAAIAPRLSRHRRADAQLAAAYPDKSDAWRRTALDGMWRNLGRTFAESFHLDTLAADRNRFDVTGLGEVDALFDRHGGRAVLASLHSGNWEVAVLPLLWQGRKTAGVYQRLKNPDVNADVLAARERLYPAGLFEKGDRTVREAMRVIANGGMVSVMADLRDRQGVAVPFFHKPAPSTPFPAFLARAQNVPLVAGRVVRLDGCRFRIEAEPVEVSRTDDRARDLQETTARLHATFERWVRERPEQWMWGHRRWGDTAIRSERVARGV